ncbi:SGNH/GDSL hydrolase family protein [Diaminobutyricibacter sp. McL0618]|uniref:SGNH/GDSL hydrolase family protein n=1 Tax=Leifsonia sp. McL0618 TaxID=3415677 RepID=UPI003CF9D35C
MTSLPRRLLVVAAGVATLAALSGCAAVTAERSVAAEAKVASAPHTSATVTVVAIGDSIEHGRGVLPAQAWPEQVAASRKWALDDLAINGSGFVKAGAGGYTYSAQIEIAIKLDPRIVLISATRNDLLINEQALRTKTVQLLDHLRAALPHATIVGTSAVWGDTPVPARLTADNALTRQAVTDVGGTYIDLGIPLAGHPALLQPDHVHPNAAGQTVVAGVVNRALDAAHITG